jgi:hypothetical protein
MEVRQLNRVDVPVDVLDLAAVDPTTAALLQQATTIDFDHKGGDLLIQLRLVMGKYHWELKTAHCSPMTERICHGVARKAAEARGTPMPPPFDPRKDDPKTRAVKLIKAFQITLQDVADAIGGDQEEAGNILDGSNPITARQRRDLIKLLKARTPSAMTDKDVDRVMAKTRSAAAEQLVVDLKKIITEAAGRKPMRVRIPRVSTKALPPHPGLAQP